MQYVQPGRQKTTGRPSTALSRCASSALMGFGKIKGEFRPASARNTGRSTAAAAMSPLTICAATTAEPQSTNSIDRSQARIMVKQPSDEPD
jgi:hypothetical protein